MDHADDAHARLLAGDIREPLASTFTLFLLQVLIILVFSRLISGLCSMLKQPGVVGEMIAGILLGPTALGKIPGWTSTLFPSSSMDSLSTVASFGLCFFMLSVGMEMDIPNVTRNWRSAFLLAFAGLAVPCGASYGLAVLFAEPAFSSASVGVLGLFLTVALGIISLPVLARILKDRKVDIRLQELVMSVAVVEDILAYVLLAVVTVLVKPSVGADSIGIIVGATVAECLFVFLPLRSAVNAIVDRSQALNKTLDAGTFIFLCVCLIACCLVTNIIGLSFMIGAFQMGMIIPRTSGLAHQISEKVEFFCTAVLMPIYFAVSGLKTDFSRIDSAASWGLAVLLIVVALASKFFSVYVACRAVAIPPIMSRVVSALMTCKGLIALVVLNVGLDAKAITQKFFSILVLMVIVCTVGTVPLVNLMDPASRKEDSAREMEAYSRALDEKQHPAPQSELVPAAADAVAGGAAAGAGRVTSPLIGGSGDARGATLSRRFGRTTRGISLAGEELHLVAARARAPSALSSAGAEGGEGAPGGSGAQGAVVWASTPVFTAATPALTGISRSVSFEQRSRASSTAAAPGGGEGGGSSGAATPKQTGAAAPSGVFASPLLLPAMAAPGAPDVPPLPGLSLLSGPRAGVAEEAAVAGGPPPAPAPAPPKTPQPLLLPAPPAPRLRVCAAFSEPASLGPLVTVADFFAPLPEAGQPHHCGASLAVHWLQGNLDMPSALVSGEGLDVLDRERHDQMFDLLSTCAAARAALPEELPPAPLALALGAAAADEVALEVAAAGNGDGAPLSASLTPVPEEGASFAEDEAGAAAAAAASAEAGAPRSAPSPARTPEQASRPALPGQRGSALSFVASLSSSPWQDAQAVAAREAAHLLLVTSRLPVVSQGALEVTSQVLTQVVKDMKTAFSLWARKESAGVEPTEGDHEREHLLQAKMQVTLEAVRAAATSARAHIPPAGGLLAVLFGWDHLHRGVRVAVLPLAEGDSTAGPAAQLLQRTSPAALSVHVVRAGDGSSGGGGGGGAPAALHPSLFSTAHATSDGKVEGASTVPACLQRYLEQAEATEWHGQGAPPIVLLDGDVGRTEAEAGECTLLDALTVCAEFRCPALVVWGGVQPV